MVVRPQLVTLTGALQAAVGVSQITMIANHFKSKLGGAKPEPRRQAQGAFVGDMVDQRRAANPSVPVIVLGDLNASYQDGAFQKLATRADGSQRLADMPMRLDAADRYTYSYRGSHDMLDHLLVTPELEAAATSVHIPHFNTPKDAPKRAGDATVPDGVSDHDPIVVDFDLSKLGAAHALAGASKLATR